MTKEEEFAAALAKSDFVQTLNSACASAGGGSWDSIKKTVLRRLCKLLPLSPEVAEHIEKDQDIREIDVTPVAKAALNLPSSQEASE